MVCRYLAGHRLGDYFVIYIRTLARRKEPHIYVANWYYMAFILVVAMLHIVNNLAVPVSLGQRQELFGSSPACRMR